MALTSSYSANMFMPDFGVKPDDIRYFSIDSRIQGRGPNRLKYLDLEGRWVLSGRSIPYISAAFQHLEHLNNAQVPLRDITQEPINAIGMVGWTKSSTDAVPTERKPKFIPSPTTPVYIEEEEVPPSPREPMPHRSAGYGPAHQKRKLSVPDRSRSASPLRAESPQPVFDKYAKYERHRKDSITRYGTKWGPATGDLGYSSSGNSPVSNDGGETLPHRTPSLSPRPASRTRYYDNDYDSTLIHKADSNRNLKVLTKDTNGDVPPYRTTGYGAYHVKRQYELSPRSLGSDYATSESEQSSPVPYRKQTTETYVRRHLRTNS
ncbi:unnamed protein product [Caenorhabditis auriculariae]|uniref:Uncharacterized protein n=1 Tax=Caenorhabditis auriculariae TaxID=2777116 RepID=A0A8S1HX00_9PELO|nr:unnamed protein product [Caenorhabditis auriculariae]